MINRIRVPLGFLVAAAVIYLATPTGVTILSGLPIALAGAFFRALAAGTIRKDSRLATEGPYAWTRNPLYFGSFILAAGFAVMSGNWVAAGLLVLPSLLIYPVVIRNEEAHLQRLFGDDFRAYCSKVPRFVPRLRLPYSGSFAFSQYWANREYNVAAGFLAAVILLFLKRGP